MQHACTTFEYSVLPSTILGNTKGLYVNTHNNLNTINFLQKLTKYIKCIQVKFSKLPDDETEEFNQI